MNKINGAIKNFKKNKICVFGDVFLDKYSWGICERRNPEQPATPLIDISRETYALGGGSNVANNIVSLGAKCSLYGVIGKDVYGEKLKELILKKGVGWKGFEGKDPTILKQRIIEEDHNHYIARADYGELPNRFIDESVEKRFIESFKEEIKGLDLIIFSDYNKGLFKLGLAQKIIKLAKEREIPSLVDPKPQNINSFWGCTIVRPNERDSSKIVGMTYKNGKERLKKMCGALCNRTSSQYSVITCGKDGAFGYDSRNKKSFKVGTKAKEVIDVTGAGDTFISVLALATASDLNLEESLELANCASGIVVEKIGTATTNTRELLERISK